MNATSIVLLIGVCSFWVVVGVLLSLFGRIRKVLESMGDTLGEIRSDLSRLTPVLSDTLQEVEKTGHEVGQTASEIRVLTNRINTGNAAAVVSGTVNYLPLVVTVLKAARPLFDRMRRSRQ
jgi:Sec-independent protein translocase protein TatA